MCELIPHCLRTACQPIAGVVHGVTDVVSGGPQAVAQVRGLALDGLVAFLHGICGVVQAVPRAVNAVRHAIGPLADPAVLWTTAITDVRAWGAILAHHQPQQPHRGQHGGHRIVAHAGTQVGEERGAVALHHAPRLVKHLARGELAFQCIDDVANAGALRVDFTLDRFRAFFRFQFEFAFHETFLRRASWSLFKASRVRSGLKWDGSNCFLPDCSMANPMIITTTPTISAASQGAITIDRP